MVSLLRRMLVIGQKTKIWKNVADFLKQKNDMVTTEDT